MRLIQCMHTQNDCYTSNVSANSNVKPIGIVVHSTGANNTNLKRYVQPSNNDTNRTELLKLIGTNTSNSWNRSGVSKAVHYFIGKLADGTVATAHILPENFYCWGCGKGSYGSYNYEPYAHIQFEICEDDLTNADYFRTVIKEAQELCADICLRHNWNASVIVSHKEAHAKGYGSNHRDIDHWLSWYGKTMAWFRNEVQALINEAKKPIPEPEPIVEPYIPSVNEVVEYVGTVHYYSSNSTTPKTCKPGIATCTRIYNGKHPYQLVNIANDEDGVHGWVDAEFIRKYDKPIEETKKEEEEPAVEVVPEPTPEPEPEVVAPEPAPAPEVEEDPTPTIDPEPEPEVEEDNLMTKILHLFQQLLETIVKFFKKEMDEDK